MKFKFHILKNIKIQILFTDIQHSLSALDVLFACLCPVYLLPVLDNTSMLVKHLIAAQWRHNYHTYPAQRLAAVMMYFDFWCSIIEAGPWVQGVINAAAFRTPWRLFDINSVFPIHPSPTQLLYMNLEKTSNCTNWTLRFENQIKSNHI